MSEAVYATRHSCGHIVAAAVADKSAAKDVAQWVKDGRVIETIPLEEARTETWCSCFRESQKDRKATGGSS